MTAQYNSSNNSSNSKNHIPLDNNRLNLTQNNNFTNNNHLSNNNEIINNSPSSNTHIGSKLHNTWRICTTNTRGLNTPGKNIQAIEIFNDLNLDFLILTETKLNNNNAKFCFSFTEHTHIYTTNITKQFGIGLSIIIHKNLAKHIQKIIKIDGRLIHLSLAFKGNITIHIIACYFPATINQHDNVTK